MNKMWDLDQESSPKIQMDALDQVQKKPEITKTLNSVIFELFAESLCRDGFPHSSLSPYFTRFKCSIVLTHQKKT